MWREKMSNTNRDNRNRLSYKDVMRHRLTKEQLGKIERLRQTMVVDYQGLNDAKRASRDWDMMLRLRKNRDVPIDLYDFVGDDRSKDDKLSIKLWQVSAKKIGLNPNELRYLAKYKAPEQEIKDWLEKHRTDNKDGKPRRYQHSRTVVKYLNKAERKMWRKAEGWSWSFEYGVAWNKKGQPVKPSTQKGRLKVLGKGLHWWIMVEWLSRTHPKIAADVIHGKYQVHHRKPWLLDTAEGNSLINLAFIKSKPDHSYISSTQRKIRKYYKTHKK